MFLNIKSDTPFSALLLSWSQSGKCNAMKKRIECLSRDGLLSVLASFDVHRILRKRKL